MVKTRVSEKIRMVLVDLKLIALLMSGLVMAFSLVSCAGGGNSFMKKTCDECSAAVTAFEQKCSALLMGSSEYEKCKTELRMSRYQAGVNCKTQGMDASSRNEMQSLFARVVGPLDIAPDITVSAKKLDNGDLVVPSPKKEVFPASVCSYDRDDLCEQTGALYLGEIANEICPEGTHLPQSKDDVKVVYEYIDMMRKYVDENVGSFFARIVKSSQLKDGYGYDGYVWNKQDLIYTHKMTSFWVGEKGLGRVNVVGNMCESRPGLSACLTRRDYAPVFCVVD